MAHETLEAFGYPQTLVKEYEHWCVVLRPKQATAGALVLIAKSDEKAFSALPREAFTEKHKVVGDIETALKSTFSYDKINYLMLMMVDPQVHYHVLPRYAEDREFNGHTYTDPGWPALPELGSGPVLEGHDLEQMRNHIRSHWPD